MSGLEGTQGTSGISGMIGSSTGFLKITQLLDNAPASSIAGPGIVPDWTTTYTSTDGTTLMLNFSFTCYSTFDTTPAQSNILIDGNVAATTSFYFNKSSVHQTIPCLFNVENLSAGTHTIELQISSDIQVDSNDFAHFSIIETMSSGQSGISGTDGQSGISGLAGGGASLEWYAENVTPPTTAPIATGSGSIAIGDNAQGLSSNMFVVGDNAGVNAVSSPKATFIGYYAGNGATNAYNANFIGVNAGQNATFADKSNFIGHRVGEGATNAYRSNFIGRYAGYQATGATNSNIIGQSAGYGAYNGYYSNFIGSQAGYQATEAVVSNFIGYLAGYQAYSAYYSNFMGYYAGYQAYTANYSNLIGYQAGFDATNASYSNLIGWQAGKTFTSNNIGTNNIIIGTNISLPNATTNAINIGGVLFGTGVYNYTNTDPSITAQTNGKIGIGVVSPTANLHIAASTTAAALMRLEVGVAPDSPNDGDIWLESNTDTGLKIRISGVTKTITLS